ncbi:MAG: S-methyl-5-thioribose-1-phosphate isomerase [Chitinivibrionales bacterium]
MSRLKTIEWTGGAARIVDQTLLPTRLVYEDVTNIQAMWDAIKILKIRGAPAIGIAAAFGLYLGVKELDGGMGKDAFLIELEKHADYLASSRPTAVNLFWALDRMKKVARDYEAKTAKQIQDRLLEEAQTILQEDRQTCRSIGEYGFEELKDKKTLLTHCNAGGLATSEYGTALAPIYIAKEKGHAFSVFADETRPLLQGARITAFELAQAGIHTTLICDNMAATVMRQGKVDAVIVGADRIARNGDVANKIGTYGVALLAKAHDIPFYVAAPASTFDITLDSGTQIPIEERDRVEVVCGFGKQTAPEDVLVFNPAFDVTPHELVTGIITEQGILRAPFEENINTVFQAAER